MLLMYLLQSQLAWCTFGGRRRPFNNARSHKSSLKGDTFSTSSTERMWWRWCGGWAAQSVESPWIRLLWQQVWTKANSPMPTCIIYLKIMHGWKYFCCLSSLVFIDTLKMCKFSRNTWASNVFAFNCQVSCLDESSSPPDGHSSDKWSRHVQIECRQFLSP